MENLVQLLQFESEKEGEREKKKTVRSSGNLAAKEHSPELLRKMPTSAKVDVVDRPIQLPSVTKEEEEEVAINTELIKCSINMTDPDQDAVDRSHQTTSTQQQLPQQQTKEQKNKKKLRKSLTSFSIFRKDKKFSESKIEVVSDKAKKEPTTKSLVLDNTRLEVGLCSLLIDCNASNDFGVG